MLKKLKELLKNYWNTVFPITKIHELITEPYWREGKVEVWKEKLISSISMCRLHERVLNLKLAALYKENLLKDIYGNF